jgi:CRP-like cAMP-binding protein
MRIGNQDDPPNGHGPSIAAVALWGASGGRRAQLLTEEERARLSVIASIVRFKKGEQIYREGDRADAVLNIVSGIVKSYRILPDKTERIAAFLFADDLFGLAEEGRYVNAARAVTAVTAYRIPVSALERRLRKDAVLEFHVICKLCQELRETQRHALLLGRKNALARLAMFFQLLEQHRTANGEAAEELYLPMSRSDVAAYLGMSLEAVSRSFRTLARRGVIAFRNKRSVKVTDRGQLESLAALVERADNDDGETGPHRSSPR